MSQSLIRDVALVAAGAVAGIVNAIAGGGSLISFPALVLVGLPPITANATNSLALWPGYLSSVPALRSWLGQPRALIVPCVVSIAGGALGAVLLVLTPPGVFVRIIPLLILAGTMLFAVAPWLQGGLGGHGRAQNRAGFLVGLFPSAAYGGYFGAGLGIMLLAALSVTGETDIRAANAKKNLLSVLINTAAVTYLVIEGVVNWPAALVTMVGSILGGYAGARLSLVLPRRVVRTTVILLGVGLTVYFMTRR